jgi:hypothetical protein
MPALTRPQKITLAEMRTAGVRSLLLYSSDFRCSHWTAISGDRRPDDAACPIWSRGLPARPVAGAARVSDQISVGKCRGAELAPIGFNRPWVKKELSVDRQTLSV